MIRKSLRLCAFVFATALFAGCNTEKMPEYGDLLFEWDNVGEAAATQVIYPESSRSYEFRAENLDNIIWENLPSGWDAQLDTAARTITVISGNNAADNGKIFTLKMTVEGLADDSINQELSFYYVDPEVMAFDDPDGVFVLNEGNMTTENGSLTYITPDGYVLDNIYRQVNGTELGNVCQDMCIHDGKIYIISQNGDENPIGTEFENDGMLVVVDARTLRKLDSYTKEDLNMLSWPSHISVIDEEHVYIRDNGVEEGDNGSGRIWRLNTTDRTVKEVGGTTGVPKSPMYRVGDKLYTYKYSSTTYFSYFYILEITGESDTATEYKAAITKFIPVNIRPDQEENVFWVLLKDENEEYYSMGKTRLLDYGRLEQVKSAALDDIPDDGASGVRFVSPDSNTFYYTSGSFVIKGMYSETDGAGSADGKQITVETEVMADLTELDSDAREVYNGLGIHPLTGHIYVNTIKGMGNMYTTNQIWEFNFNAGNEPVSKWSDYTNFPAGFFFPETNM